MPMMTVNIRYEAVSTRAVEKKLPTTGSLRRCAAAPSPAVMRRSNVNSSSWRFMDQSL
jgi:hypothetical protein